MFQLNMKNAYMLQQLLVIREKLPVRYAGVLASAVFNDFDETVRAGFLLWMDEKLPEDFQSGQYTLSAIMQSTGATQVEALCMMNTFAQHPEKKTEVTWIQKKEKLDVKI